MKLRLNSGNRRAPRENAGAGVIWIRSSAICKSSMPEIIAQVRNAPEDLPADFPNVKTESGCALTTCVERGESVGAFGPKE